MKQLLSSAMIRRYAILLLLKGALLAIPAAAMPADAPAQRPAAAPAVAPSAGSAVTSGTVAAPTPARSRAARSVHLAYQAPAGTVFYNEVAVEVPQNSTYFCVCGFDGGYFGIQQLGSENSKIVIFSVWDPGSQNDQRAVPEDQRVKVLYQGKDVYAGRFGGEGTGGQSKFTYNWNAGETYRFLVKATVKGDWTAYAGYFYLNETKEWKHLATFETLAKGRVLTGYYSFIEDFRRNWTSATLNRRARYGNGWIRTLDGKWQPITLARFTADRTPLDNIDAGAKDGRFYLATGGDTPNTRPLRSMIECPAAGPMPKDLEIPPDQDQPDRDKTSTPGSERV